MSKGLKAFNRLIKFLNQQVWEEDLPNTYNRDYFSVEKELKALEIIKNKKVNIYNIWVFDDYTQYKEHYPFSEYHAIEDMLTFKEFDLLKEMKDNE